MSASVSRSLLAGLLMVAVVGCETNPFTTPATTTTIDLGALLTENSVNVINNIPGVRGLLGLPVIIVPPTVLPNSCALSAATMLFVCPTQTAGGLTFDVSYSLMDATGARQTAFSTTTTASARAIAATKGTVATTLAGSTSASLAILDNSDMTSGGLLLSEQTLSGTSTSHYDLTGTGGTATHTVSDVTTTTVNVVFPPLSSLVGWPLSGTITNDVTTVTTTGTAAPVTTTTHLLIVFNATSTPTATLTTGGVTYKCLIDLSGVSVATCS